MKRHDELELGASRFHCCWRRNRQNHNYYESINLAQLLIFQQSRQMALRSWFDIQTLKTVIWNSQEGSINLTGRKRSQSLLDFCGVFKGKTFASCCSVSLLSGDHQVFIVKPRRVSLIYVGQNHKSQTLPRDLQCVPSVMLSWMYFAWAPRLSHI